MIVDAVRYMSVHSGPIPETLESLRPKLAALARGAPLALAGAGATPQLVSAVGARWP